MKGKVRRKNQDNGQRKNYNELNLLSKENANTGASQLALVNRPKINPKNVIDPGKRLRTEFWSHEIEEQKPENQGTKTKSSKVFTHRKTQSKTKGK